MTKEEKKLLIKDLCARLPYEPIVEYVLKAFGGGNATMTCTLDTIHLEDLLQDSEDLVHIKPYLRPMSTMTEEEHNEWFNYYHEIELKEAKSTGDYLKAAILGESASIDWLNKKMFDFRGLIPKDLALSTEEYNPYKV